MFNTRFPFAHLGQPPTTTIATRIPVPRDGTRKSDLFFLTP
ncbi:hypothetical protein SLEP1_g59563 [Rubroshorea leprosula]|uniref:Uncharacterized protein n=1 Tax=Rubroshorea leprosula TaxID=152421 RepID=A0AAV5KXQ0_9ROSI|nr:hypothetical protein SLEP1_g38602 [Rubroshorea leprosula]GKV53013.1 hypothetical protein SLEP1_g59563 [Rubroshorea leprosula]